MEHPRGDVTLLLVREWTAKAEVVDDMGRVGRFGVEVMFPCVCFDGKGPRHTSNFKGSSNVTSLDRMLPHGSHGVYVVLPSRRYFISVVIEDVLNEIVHVFLRSVAFIVGMQRFLPVEHSAWC